jgi:hypothetical protein
MSVKIGAKEAQRRALRERQKRPRKYLKVLSDTKAKTAPKPSGEDLVSPAALLGRLGGIARAKALSPERRTEIARMGSDAANAKRAKEQQT